MNGLKMHDAAPCCLASPQSAALGLDSKPPALKMSEASLPELVRALAFQLCSVSVFAVRLLPSSALCTDRFFSKWLQLNGCSDKRSVSEGGE